jgi:hypothetical protein
VRARAQQWRQVLERRAPESKFILEGLLAGRIVITPRESAGEFTVHIRLKATGLLEGVISPKALASPRQNSDLYKQVRGRFPLAA